METVTAVYDRAVIRMNHHITVYLVIGHNGSHYTKHVLPIIVKKGTNGIVTACKTGGIEAFND